MKKKQKIILVGLLILVLVISSAAYLVNRSSSCYAAGVRSSDCKPPNNRCFPPGDPREAVVDCAEFKYYESK